MNTDRFVSFALSALITVVVILVALLVFLPFRSLVTAAAGALAGVPTHGGY